MKYGNEIISSIVYVLSMGCNVVQTVWIFRDSSRTSVVGKFLTLNTAGGHAV